MPKQQQAWAIILSTFGHRPPVALAGAPRQNFAFVGWLLIGRSSNVGSCVMSDAVSLVHTPSKNLSAFAPSKYMVVERHLNYHLNLNYRLYQRLMAVQNPYRSNGSLCTGTLTMTLRTLLHKLLYLWELSPHPTMRSAINTRRYRNKQFLQALHTQ